MGDSLRASLARRLTFTPELLADATVEDAICAFGSATYRRAPECALPRA